MIYYTFDRAVLKSYNLYQSTLAEQRRICYGLCRNLLIYLLECGASDEQAALIFWPGDYRRVAFRTDGQRSG